MSATTTESSPTQLHLLARYELPEGRRLLLGRRIKGEVFVYDYPEDGGRPYFVESGFASKRELAHLIVDYRRQAGRLGTCPMSRV